MKRPFRLAGTMLSWGVQQTPGRLRNPKQHHSLIPIAILVQ